MDLQNCIAFGDNFNDEEMLKEVGHPFLMGNAPAELKQRFSSEQITAGNFCGSDGICFCSYGNVQTVFPPLCVSCSGTPYDPGVPEKCTFCSVGNGKRKENS